MTRLPTRGASNKETGQNYTCGFGGPGGVGGGNGEPESASNCWIGATPGLEETVFCGKTTAAAKLTVKSSAMLVRTICMLTSGWELRTEKYCYVGQGVKSRDVDWE